MDESKIILVWNSDIDGLKNFIVMRKFDRRNVIIKTLVLSKDIFYKILNELFVYLKFLPRIQHPQASFLLTFINVLCSSIYYLEWNVAIDEKNKHVLVRI